MSQKLSQIELLGLAFEGVQARNEANSRLKQVIVDMYKEEVEKQKAEAEESKQQANAQPDDLIQSEVKE